LPVDGFFAWRAGVARVRRASLRWAEVLRGWVRSVDCAMVTA